MLFRWSIQRGSIDMKHFLEQSLEFRVPCLLCRSHLPVICRLVALCGTPCRFVAIPSAPAVLTAACVAVDALGTEAMVVAVVGDDHEAKAGVLPAVQVVHQ